MVTSTFRIFLLPLLACILLLSISGCTSRTQESFQTPDIQLVDAQIVRAKLLEQEFKLRFRIDNPNSKSLPLRRMNYSLQLNGIPLAHDQRSIRVTVPANGHAYIEIPVLTNLWRHVRTLMSVMKSPNDQVNYSLNAEIVTGGFFSRSFTVSRSGDINPNSF